MVSFDHQRASGSSRAPAAPLQSRLRITSPVVQRAPTCACGGTCPRCQAKSSLTVSQPNDPAEREADAVAEQIMRMPESFVQPEHGRLDPGINIQRNPTSDAHMRKNASDIQVSQSGGRPLALSTRQFMEPRFGTDFGHVRVHTDHDAHQTAAKIQARAFTTGHHIWLGKGESEHNVSLLAHELTHVVQQSGQINSTVQRQPACGTSTTATTVDVYVVELPGAARNASADVARADSIWHQCSKQINMVGGESWQTNVLDVEAPTGILNAPASTVRPLTAEETQMTAYRPGGDVIHAYYVPNFTGPKVAEAFWPAQHGQSSVIVGNNARSDSFAHELGHVLLNSGTHETDPDNLMASGSIRNVGVDKLECRQC